MARPPSDKRSRILDAAIHCFGERSFPEVKLDLIAERAGVAKGTIYLYFTSKEALFCECLLPSQDWFEQASRIIEGRGSIHDRLLALIELQNDIYTQKGPLIQQMLQFESSLSFSPQIMSRVQSHLRHVVMLNSRLFQEGIDSGVFADRLTAEQMAVIFIQIFDLRVKFEALRVKPLENHDIFNALLRLFGNP